MIHYLRYIVDFVMLPIHYLFAFIVGRRKTSQKPRLAWGPVPMKNYHYSSSFMKEIGYQSSTFVFSPYHVINKNEDFDIIVDDFRIFKLPFMGRYIKALFYRHFSFIFSLMKFDIVFSGFNGWCLGDSLLRKHEARLLRLARKKIVVMSYGADTFAYSQVHEPLLRHGLMVAYPHMIHLDKYIQSCNEYWQYNSDAMITSFALDHIGRWDLLPYNYITIDEKLIRPRNSYSNSDGTTGEVKIYHCPNSKGLKGTEFLEHAVKELQEEGLKLRLIIIQGIQNEEVIRLLREDADILAEQFILNGYGLNGIEGMCVGLPILCNLNSPFYNDVFRSYSYLNECPAVSTGPEEIKQNLRLLITNPELRERLGKAGRMYIEKYHSRATAVYMYDSIIRKIWFNEKIELIHLFHPLRDNPLNKIHPKIETGLQKNRLVIS